MVGWSLVDCLCVGGVWCLVGVCFSGWFLSCSWLVLGWFLAGSWCVSVWFLAGAWLVHGWFLGGGWVDWWVVILGLSFVITTLYAPKGIGGLVEIMFRKKQL